MQYALLQVLITSSGHPLAQRGHLGDLGDLEAAGHELLEDTEGVILLSSSLHLLDVGGAVAAKRILGDVGIVEVQVRVVGADALRVGADAVDEVGTGLLEESILVGTLPRDIRLVHCRVVRLGFGREHDVQGRELTAKVLAVEALETEDVSTTLGTTAPVGLDKRLVKDVDAPVAGGLGLQIGEHIEVDLVGLSHDAEVIGEGQSAEVDAGIGSTGKLLGEIAHVADTSGIGDVAGNSQELSKARGVEDRLGVLVRVQDEIGTDSALVDGHDDSGVLGVLVDGVNEVDEGLEVVLHGLAGLGVDDETTPHAVVVEGAELDVGNDTAALVLALALFCTVWSCFYKLLLPPLSTWNRSGFEVLLALTISPLARTTSNSRALSQIIPCSGVK